MSSIVLGERLAFVIHLFHFQLPTHSDLFPFWQGLLDFLHLLQKINFDRLRGRNNHFRLVG